MRLQIRSKREKDRTTQGSAIYLQYIHCTIMANTLKRWRDEILVDRSKSHRNFSDGENFLKIQKKGEREKEIKKMDDTGAHKARKKITRSKRSPSCLSPILKGNAGGRSGRS